MSRRLDALRLFRDTSATGLWLVVRVLSLAAWLWMMVLLLAMDEFGWLAGVLGISAIGALVAGAGLPYLFFFDGNSADPAVLAYRWQELSGVLLVLGPVATGFATLVVLLWAPLPISIGLLIPLLVCEIIFVAYVQAAALLLHAKRDFIAASGLPAILGLGRALAALASIGFAYNLVGYLLLHLASVVLVAITAYLWVRRRCSGSMMPCMPAFATIRRSFSFCLMSAATLATSELDKPLLGRIAGLDVTGHYAFAFRICSTAVMPVTALSAALLPRWTRMYLAGEKAKIIESFLLAACAVTIFCGGLSFGFSILIGMAPEGLFGINAEVRGLLERLLWIGVPIGLHQLAGVGLVALGAPLMRAFCDCMGLAVIAVLFYFYYGIQGVSGLPLACILAESVTAISMGAIFVVRSSMADRDGGSVSAQTDSKGFLI